MTKPNPVPKVADEVPWYDGITEYDTGDDPCRILILVEDMTVAIPTALVRVQARFLLMSKDRPSTPGWR